MRLLAALLFAALLLFVRDAAIPYFSNMRDVTVLAPDRQNYIVVDEDIWNHARSDLAEVRLYDGHTQVPYVLKQQRRSRSDVEQQVKILNLGKVGEHTEFDIDVGKLPEYDRVRLELDAKDFVATALISGMNALEGGQRTQLSPSTLYDFSRENLGSNSLLKLPTSSFRYLHVQLGAGIRPEQVKGATGFNLEEKKANWEKVGSCRIAGQQDNSTAIECDVPARVPLDRLQFQVLANPINFRRKVSVVNVDDLQIASGYISRVRVMRAGSRVDSENLTVEVSGSHSEHFTVKIDNGDDPALGLESVQPLSVERRIYFDPNGKTSLRLYYGDEKLGPPVYDYAEFFQESAAAAEAQLGPAMHNPTYTGRPDERPWSERHKAVLWIAMLLVVAVLAALAVRGLLSPNRPQSPI